MNFLKKPKNLAILAGVGVAGYLAYRYFYAPVTAAPFMQTPSGAVVANPAAAPVIEAAAKAAGSMRKRRKAHGAPAAVPNPADAAPAMSMAGDMF